MPGVTIRDDVTIPIGRLNCKSMSLLKGSPRCSLRKTERRTEHAQFLQTQITAHDGDLMMTTPKYIGPDQLGRLGVLMKGRGHRPGRIEPALPRSVFGVGEM